MLRRTNSELTSSCLGKAVLLPLLAPVQLLLVLLEEA
jgi:hypothetical protein